MLKSAETVSRLACSSRNRLRHVDSQLCFISSGDRIDGVAGVRKTAATFNLHRVDGKPVDHAHSKGHYLISAINPRACRAGNLAVEHADRKAKPTLLSALQVIQQT